MLIRESERKDLWLNVACSLVGVWAGVACVSSLVACRSEVVLCQALMDLEHVGRRIVLAADALVEGMAQGAELVKEVRENVGGETSSDAV